MIKSLMLFQEITFICLFTRLYIIYLLNRHFILINHEGIVIQDILHRVQIVSLHNKLTAPSGEVS